MRTLLRMESRFGSSSKPSRFLEYLSNNSSRSSLQKPSMSGKREKKWFSATSFQSSFSKKKSSVQAQHQQPSSQAQSPPRAQIYTPSQPQEQSQPKPSKRKKAWQRTKSFLSSIGEPPTAEYDRQQAALRLQEGNEKGKGEVNRNGREAFGAVNFGPYHQGGPWQGGRL